jgi:hypothetical protein
VRDGDDLGDFPAGESLECSVEGYDPDGGTVWFNWEATGQASVNPRVGEDVVVSNEELGITETVSVTISDDDDGQPMTWSFSFAMGQGPVFRMVTVDGKSVENGDYAGCFDYSHPVECEVFAYDPDGGEVSYHWEATGDAVLWPENGDHTFLSNLTVHTVETVTIFAEDDTGGKSSEFTFTFKTGYAPVFNGLEVAGIDVAPGDFAGTFLSNYRIISQVWAEDPNGETLEYSWNGTGDTVMEPSDRSWTEFWNPTPGRVEKVTITVRSGADGPEASRCFYFDTEDYEGDEMKLIVIPHPDEPESRIRLVLSVSDMVLPSVGVSLDINYDHNKLYAEDTRIWDEDDDDCHVHGNCPFGADALNLFWPELVPANMTVSGFEATTQGGPVLFVDFLVIGGSGTSTDFTFGDPDNCVFANADGHTFRSARKLIPALDVQLP